MTTENESALDATDNTDTTYELDFTMGEDTFEGHLYNRDDTDWIRIKLNAGNTYTITLQGYGKNPVDDTVLKIYDARGNEIREWGNDNVDFANGDKSSRTEFTATYTGTYYVSASGYPGNPNLDSSRENYVINFHAPEITKANLGIRAYAGDGEILQGTEGNDQITGLGNSHLLGHDGHDQLSSYSGNNILDGGAGDDTLKSGPGADVLIGGPGIDTLSFTRSDEGVLVRLHSRKLKGGAAQDDTFGGPGSTVYYPSEYGYLQARQVVDIENIEGSDRDDILAGDIQDNHIQGGFGNDILYGGPLGGHDVLEGGSGDDELHGGIGNDLLYGGFDNDKLWGGPGDDKLIGGDGTNELEGGTGDDTFVVETGSYDKAIIKDFGNGNDKIDLTELGYIDQRELRDSISQQGGDVIFDLNRFDGGIIVVQSQDGNSISIDDFFDANEMVTDAIVLSDANKNTVGTIYIGNDRSGGIIFDQRIVATEKNDYIEGRGGKDVIYGLQGDDTLLGGSGNDIIEGGAGDDILRGDDGIDILRGGFGADTLIGGSDYDKLDGGPGNDILDSSTGRASMIGGAGDDIFVFNDQSNYFDPFDPFRDPVVFILDFGTGKDIDLDGIREHIEASGEDIEVTDPGKDIIDLTDLGKITPEQLKAAISQQSFYQVTLDLTAFGGAEIVIQSYLNPTQNTDYNGPSYFYPLSIDDFIDDNGMPTDALLIA